MGYWKAKLAAVRGTPTKKSVSTKGIFNKSEYDPARGLKARAPKVSKTSKPGKASQHPSRKSALGTAFSDSIEAAHKHITEVEATDFEATRTGLSQRLGDMNIQYDMEEKVLTESLANLHLPFKSEEIEFRSEDGKQSGVIVLGHRMKKFQKTIDVEAAELERQYEEWLANEEEIDKLAAEFTVPETSDEMNVDKKEEIRIAWEELLEEELEGSRAGFLEQIGLTSEESIKDMTDCEKAFVLDQKKMQDTFSALLQNEEMYTG